jgi:hypothetical protein
MADHQIRHLGKDPSTLFLAGVFAAPLIGPCLFWICFAANLGGVALSGVLLIQVSMTAAYGRSISHWKSRLSTSRIGDGSARGRLKPAPGALASTSPALHPSWDRGTLRAFRPCPFPWVGTPPGSRSRCSWSRDQVTNNGCAPSRRNLKRSTQTSNAGTRKALP